MRESLEKLLAKGVDNPLLRFGLGKACLDQQDGSAASEHLHRCVAQQPGYSAAWKLLGKALLLRDDAQGARQAWQQGLAAAQAQGDKQAEREIGVFLKRLERNAE